MGRSKPASPAPDMPRARPPSYHPSRLPAKLGVRETARRVGVSAAHVSNILSGKRRPSLDVARRLANACGMSLNALVDLMDRVDRIGPKAI